MIMNIENGEGQTDEGELDDRRVVRAVPPHVQPWHLPAFGDVLQGPLIIKGILCTFRDFLAPKQH